MIVFNRKKLNFKIRYVYFNESSVNDNDQEYGITRYYQSKILKTNAQYIKPFDTLIIDLKLDEKNIFGEFRKSVRYEINEIEKQNASFDVYSNKEVLNNLDEFENDYKEFSSKKNIPNIDRELINKLIDNVYLTRACSESGSEIVWHMYIADSVKTRLLYSCSVSNNENNNLAKLNKWLHWNDMRYFKILKYSEYDLGGVDIKSKEMAGINNFKMGFSKNLVQDYNFTCYKNPLFKFIDSLRGWRY